jgi:hypothetical protein
MDLLGEAALLQSQTQRSAKQACANQGNFLPGHAPINQGWLA